jgi:hypothetical protein
MVVLLYQVVQVVMLKLQVLLFKVQGQPFLDFHLQVVLFQQAVEL